MKNEKIPKKAIQEHRQLLADIYQEHSFRLLVESVKDYAIYMLDKNGYIVSWNNGAENIKGYKASEIIGKHFSCFYTLEDQEKGLPKFGLDMAIKEGHFEREGWRLRKDGSKFWANINISPVRNEIGELIGFAKVTRDMTEKKRLVEEQQQLQLSVESVAQELQLTFTAIESPIIILDNTWKIVRLNKAAKELAQEQTQKEIIGISLEDLSNHQPWKQIFDCLKTAKNLKNAEQKAISYQVQDFTNKKSWDIAISFSKGATSESKRVIVVAKDITKLVELQESLRHSEMMSALGSLVAGVAHEVRNPLFSMSATLEAFEEDFPEHPEYKEYLDILHSELNRLTQLMKDLLEYGKPASKKLLPSTINLVITEAVKFCEHLARQKKVQIDLQISNNLPQILLDETRLVQVFQNLLDNAINHSPKNSKVIIIVSVLAEDDKNWLKIIVQDSGPGFSQEDLLKIFDPFYSRRPGGTGLGLPIVQKIVEQHKGRVFAANNPKGGAEVSVLLPVINEGKKINVKK
jgi:PAS domain S-box-containing protein